MKNISKKREDELTRQYEKKLTVNSKKKLPIIISVATVLILGAGGVGGHFAYKYINNPTPSPEPVPPTPVVEKFIVEFNTNGGDRIAAVQIEKGKQLSNPGTPSKYGCNFGGWFVDEKLQTQCKFPMIVNSDTVIYAKWETQYSDKGIGYIKNPDGNSFAAYCVNPSEIADTGIVEVPKTFKDETNKEIPITAVGTYNQETGLGQSFANCEKLKEIRLTENIKEIVPGAFYNCINLKTVDMEETEVESIGANTFGRCVSLETIKFDDSLIEIAGDEDGFGAFSNCTKLNNVTLPRFLLRIGSYAFMNCVSLKTLTMNNQVMKIGDNAFANCDLLEEVTIPCSTIEIGENAFSSCNTSEFIFKDEVSGWQNENGESITITAKEAITNGDKIYKKAVPVVSGEYKDKFEVYFLGRKEDDPTIAYGSIKAKEGLADETITIPDTLSTDLGSLQIVRVAEYGFYGNTSIKTLNVSAMLVLIGNSAFENCSKLEAVNFTASYLTKSIGDYAFKSTNIKSFDVPTGCKTIGNGAFKYSPLTTVTLPNDIENLSYTTIQEDGETIYLSPFSDCHSLESITVRDSDSREKCAHYYYSNNGVLFQKLNDTEDILVEFPESKSDTSYTIPSTVSTVGSGAFYGAKKLTSVTIPNSVKMISEAAFTTSDSKASINDVVLTNATGLVCISKKAFAKCQFSSFNIPTQAESLLYLGSKCFSGCTNLEGPFVVPASVTYIGDNIIYGCSKMVTSSKVTFDDTNSTWNIYNDSGILKEKEFSPKSEENQKYAYQMMTNQYGSRYWIKNV